MANLYKYFHDHVKKSRGENQIPIDPKDWPEEWKTVYFKEYPRFRKVKLAPPKSKPTFGLFEALQNRKSERDFSGKPIGLKDLGQLLIYSAGIQSKIENWKLKIGNSADLNRRPYPSGGGRYPIEIYPIILKPIGSIRSIRSIEAEPGIYHFNVKNNLLEKLPEASVDMPRLLTGDWQNASFVILMSAVFDRTINKYGDFGYRLIWAECGHIGQNFYLVSRALGLKCCACAGVNEDYANELLDLDGQNETALIAYVFGR